MSGAEVLHRVGELPGHFPLCFVDDVLYTSCGSEIHAWASLDPAASECIGSLPRQPLSRLIGGLRPAERLLRLGVSHLVVTEERAVAIADKQVYVSEGSGLRRWVCVGSLARGWRPGGRPMRFGMDAWRGEVLIGEYASNPRRGPMHVYAVEPSGLVVRHRFPAGSVRHIHAVQRDPFTDQLWVTTGDYGRECRILRSGDGMRSAELIGSGDQSWRATALLFDEDAVYWGMDSPLERCQVFRWDRTTRRRHAIGELPGPIWHACANRAGWRLFSTAVEPSHRFSDPRAFLYGGVRDRPLREMMDIHKDSWSVRWFQPGLILFPTGIAPENFVVFSGTGVRGLDSTLVIARVLEATGERASEASGTARFPSAR